VDLEGSVSVFAEDTQKSNGLMFDAQGFLYACQNGDQTIVRYNPKGLQEALFTEAPSNDLVVLAEGGYYTDPHNHRVWFVDSQFERHVVDEGIAFPNGLITTPDQTMLLVDDTHGRYVYSFRIQPDGTLADKEPFGYLHLPGAQEATDADGMAVDTEGRVYVTTNLGVQVLDQLGRVNLIINKPNRELLSNVVFGGPQHDVLYVTCGGSVFKRKVKATGVVPWHEPMKPPKPGL
jgi:sugar lactone lactonase YvrE